VLTIKKGPDDVAGIPFYVKQGVCRQETIWIEPVYTLVVTESEGDPNTGEFKPITERSKSVRHSVFVGNRGESVKRLQDAFSVVGPLDAAKDAAWKEVQALADYDPQALPTDKDTFLAANHSDALTYVNYKDTYYFNAKKPFFGSGSATIELRDDGTLSKGIATSESKIAEGISALFPLKEFLSAEAIPKQKDVLVRQSARVYSLSIRTKVYKHVLRRTPETNVEHCKSEAPIELSASNRDKPGIEYFREEVQAEAGQEKGKKQGEKKIGVTGEVDLSGVLK
jgi:hypothetical protein